MTALRYSILFQIYNQSKLSLENINILNSVSYIKFASIKFLIGVYIFYSSNFLRIHQKLTYLRVLLKCDNFIESVRNR